MTKTQKHSVLALLLAATACIGSFTSASATDSSGPTVTSVPLRGEVAVQYDQSDGTAEDVSGSTAVCVPATGVDRESTGNAQNGSLHCHSLLTKPVLLGVQLNGAKLDLPVTAVGNKTLNLSGIVDTGSDGVTLNAFQIFPAGMVTPNGFNFHGSNQLVYKGITITRLVATRNYGRFSAHPTSRTGNLGFAHVSFGEKGEITTALIPILFIYTSTDQPSATTGDLDNTVGINGEMTSIGTSVTFDGNSIEDASKGSTEIYPQCTEQSTTQCSVVSPFRSVSYGQDLQAGYILSDFPLVDGQKGKYLTIGLDQKNTEGFASTQLECLTSSLAVEACNQIVHNAKFETSAKLDFTWNVIFDSGRGTVGLTVPVDSSTFPKPASLPPNETIRLTPPNQARYTYCFTTGTGFAATTLTYTDSSAKDAEKTYSNMGLEFFATNSLLLNYDDGVEGWKRASNTTN